MELQATITTQTDDLRQRFEVEAASRGYSHQRSIDWPASPDADPFVVLQPLVASAQWGQRTAVVWESKEALAQVRVQGGSVTSCVLAATPSAAAECIARVRELLPPYEASTPDVVPVTFWTASPTGGASIRRDIDAESWETIECNYPHASGLPMLMSPDFRPGVGGQLILWHGEPGTGKTTALRALAREWRSWADLHYIVDPDTFFGHRADYMMQVLTGGGDEVKWSGEKSVPRWRVLVLEDCGELLQPDAKREVGQALARLLNACDGLIGRGLRILVLLTTNESADRLHEAVGRPGRCAANIEFRTFATDEAAHWLDVHGGDEALATSGLTLADLYGRLNDFRVTRREHAVGFAA